MPAFRVPGCRAFSGVPRRRWVCGVRSTFCWRATRHLRRLNREFRGKNKATDVLSFPAAEDVAGEHAGDLAISLATAARQAAEHGHTLRDEVRVLLLHGLLHLHGMDHEADGGEMAAREAALRRSLRLPFGLIARAAREGGAGPRRGAAKAGRKP